MTFDPYRLYCVYSCTEVIIGSRKRKKNDDDSNLGVRIRQHFEDIELLTAYNLL